MSKVKPEILTPPNPSGIDFIISEIQQNISDMIFIDKDSVSQNYFNNGLILPLAMLDEQSQKPIVYWKGKDYYPAQPNDNFRSVTFFYQEDSNNSAGINESVYNINLVHWFNQDRFGRNLNYPIKESVIAEFKRKLIAYLRFENKSTISIFRETDNVFSRYSLPEKTIMKYPYFAFRINFQATIENDCGQQLINLS